MKFAILLPIFVGSVCPALCQKADTPPVPFPAPRMQIAILLDTSNSMDGLIDQAKSRLWTIVNDMATARRGGLPPQLEVALLEYGKSSLASGEGYIRCLSPLSSDLDRLSEQLFSLTTNGGDEYCGWALRSATDLAWASQPAVYRAIFIAGNEPFNQGPVDYAAICKAAIARGIVVNTIFCGDLAEGERSFWKHGAELADGSYFALDHQQVLAAVHTPYDARILELGQEMNRTYVGYGPAGGEAKGRQVAQDQAAAGVSSETAVQRTLAKKNEAYSNAQWDVVDAVKSGKLDVASPAAEAVLPEEMLELSPEKRKEAVAEMDGKRQELRKELEGLEDKRRGFLAQQNSGQKNAFDQLVLTAVRKQAGRLGFSFKE